MADHPPQHTLPGEDHFPVLFIIIFLVAFVFFAGKLILPKSDSMETNPNQPKNVIPTSTKPRDSVIFYVAQPGDTIASVAKGYQISEKTVRTANGFSETDEIEPGIKLTILPVSGYMHTVAVGETFHTIAAQYKVDPMNIINYPFNSFKNPETFELEPGQTLIVPE